MGKISIRKQEAIDYINSTSGYIDRGQVIDYLRKDLGYSKTNANKLYRENYKEPKVKSTLRKQLEAIEAREQKRKIKSKDTRPKIRIDLTNYFS